MSEVMRPHWLDRDWVIIPVCIAVILVWVVVPALGISIPVVGYFVALGVGALVGEVVGDKHQKHLLAIWGGMAAYILFPLILQLVYAWWYGHYFIFLQAMVMNPACYWAGLTLGQKDEVRSIETARKILRAS